MQREEFEQFKTEMMEALMATQADVDALTQTVTDLGGLLGTVQSDVTTSASAIQEEISKLQSGLDLSALQAAVEPLTATAQQIDDAVKALNPTPPAPEPDVEPSEIPSA